MRSATKNANAFAWDYLDFIGCTVVPNPALLTCPSFVFLRWMRIQRQQCRCCKFWRFGFNLKCAYRDLNDQGRVRLVYFMLHQRGYTLSCPNILPWSEVLPAENRSVIIILKVSIFIICT